MTEKQNENTLNLISGVSVLIMLLKESLTRVHSQKDPRLHFGVSYALKKTKHLDYVNNKIQSRPHMQQLRTCRYVSNGSDTGPISLPADY